MIPKYSSVLVLLGLFVVASCGDDPTGPTATISLTPATVTFAATVGGDNPAVQTVAITNTGTGTLGGLSATVTYTSGQPTGWLAAALNQTTAPATLTLTPTLGALAEGTYTAQVAVASTSATNSPRTVNVTFNVTALPGHTFSYTPPAGAPAITSLAVPGEFNGWDPTAPEAQMTLVGSTWQLTVQLDPGTYEYKFNINGDWIPNMCNDATWGHPPDNWVDLGATGCNEDPYGGANAYITID
jgi:hypothetical protein